MGHIFVTTDFGGSWTQADGNPTLQSPPPANALPDVPVLRLLVDRNDPTANTVLAATDIGIFRTTDGGNTWAPFNLGVIPAVAVFDIEQNLNGVVFAATHGRGIFELSGEGSPGIRRRRRLPSPVPSPGLRRQPRRSPRLPRAPALHADADCDGNRNSHRNSHCHCDGNADPDASTDRDG